MDLSDGSRKWAKRGFGKGSLITVNDMLVILSDTGTLALARLSPDGYYELASLNILEGRSWTAPSYADGKIYVRNHTHIACIEIVY